MPEFAPYSLRVAFIAQIAPLARQNRKPLYGLLGAFSALRFLCVGLWGKLRHADHVRGVHAGYRRGDLLSAEEGTRGWGMGHGAPPFCFLLILYYSTARGTVGTHFVPYG